MDIELYSKETIIPSRTKYQLKNFVINQHDTNAMKWRQILIEAQDLAYKIKMAELAVEKNLIEIHRLLSTGDPIDAIEAEEKRLAIIITERTLAGARLELSWLSEFAEDIGPYSTEDIENDQENYWALRLSRQASMDQLSTQQGVSSGTLQSMLQAGLIHKEKEEDKCAISPGN